MRSTSIIRTAVAGLLVAGATVFATATPAAAHRPPVSTWCPYRVTTESTALNVRAHHSTTSDIIGSLARGSTVTAGLDGTATGSGFTWRQVAGGWAASQYLTRTSGNCLN
jgi:hypothetical protein